MYIIRIVSCILVISIDLINAEPPANSCSDVITDFPPARDTRCCGVDSRVEVKIVGGNITEFKDYPWLVALEYHHTTETGDVERKVYCGGALISRKYILTAAHCAYNQQSWILMNVLLGAFNITTYGPVCEPTSEGDTDCTDDVIVVPIEKTISHPNFRPTNRRNDIALIKLNTTAPYTDFIRPICLPARDYTEDPPEPFDLYVAGWGIYEQYENGSGEFSDVKRHVQVPFVNKAACKEALGVNLIKGQICAGGEAGKDSCVGDSGGPLMYKDQTTFEAFGIVSYGPAKCGQENKPSVYTNVYEYLPWITSTIEAESNLT